MPSSATCSCKSAAKTQDTGLKLFTVSSQPEKSRQLLFTFSCKLEQFWGREQIKVNNQFFSQINGEFVGPICYNLRENTASVWQLGHQRKIILAWLFQQLWLQSKIIKFCVLLIIIISLLFKQESRMLNELPSIYCPLNFGIELKIKSKI